MRLDIEQIARDAEDALRAELHRDAVARKVAQLRADSRRLTLWQRLLAALPFTITWKKK